MDALLGFLFCVAVFCLIKALLETWLNPDQDPTLGYVYVITLASGVVKVGKTNNPTRRLREHEAQARKYGGGGITSRWVSDAHRGYANTERKLIQRASRLAGGPVGGKEFFTGVDPQVLIAAAQAEVDRARRKQPARSAPKPLLLEPGPTPYTAVDLRRVMVNGVEVGTVRYNGWTWSAHPVWLGGEISRGHRTADEAANVLDPSGSAERGHG